MAEALLRARLDAAGIAATVSSAGLLFDGASAEPGAIAALDRMEIDLRDHRARTISEPILRAADLVLTMEHRHVREVVLAPGGDLAKTFTLPDFVARAEEHTRAVGPRNEPVERWLAAIAADRSAADVMRGPADLEVPDPMGESRRVFRRCADDLDDLVARFVAVTWPDAASARGPLSAAARPIETGSP
jgi:protein-tyrosine-phosphatase